MKLILDASMALAWLFERQKKEEITCADRALMALPKRNKKLLSLRLKFRLFRKELQKSLDYSANHCRMVGWTEAKKQP